MATHAKQTGKKNGPEVPAEVVARTAQSISAGDEGAPTLQPDTLMSETRQEQEIRPTMTPPADTSELAVATEGIAAWHNGKKVTAMWSNSAERNSFAAVAGMGWKKLSNANDSSFLTLTMLTSHAEQVNADCNLRVESDNEVHEVYVW